MEGNIRIYGDNCEATELAHSLCEMAGVTPVVLMLNEEFREETAIAICDANYHEDGYPIIFCGSKYLGGVDELRELLKSKA
ncbi:thioredoxin-like fold protein [Vibrio phage 3.058.O._10N.286.46.B8]|nr:thioredoxin-like fold protein [Vibrio phage 3.058.O._10N.286.46.B8]